jgi:hypothetical protein
MIQPPSSAIFRENIKEWEHGGWAGKERASGRRRGIGEVERE